MRLSTLLLLAVVLLAVLVQLEASRPPKTKKKPTQLAISTKGVNSTKGGKLAAATSKLGGKKKKKAGTLKTLKAKKAGKVLKSKAEKLNMKKKVKLVKETQKYKIDESEIKSMINQTLAAINPEKIKQNNYNKLVNNFSSKKANGHNHSDHSALPIHLATQQRSIPKIVQKLKEHAKVNENKHEDPQGHSRQLNGMLNENELKQHEPKTVQNTEQQATVKAAAAPQSYSDHLKGLNGFTGLLAPQNHSGTKNVENTAKLQGKNSLSDMPGSDSDEDDSDLGEDGVVDFEEVSLHENASKNGNKGLGGLASFSSGLGPSDNKRNLLSNKQELTENDDNSHDADDSKYGLNGFTGSNSALENLSNSALESDQGEEDNSNASEITGSEEFEEEDNSKEEESLGDNLDEDSQMKDEESEEDDDEGINEDNLKGINNKLKSEGLNNVEDKKLLGEGLNKDMDELKKKEEFNKDVSKATKLALGAFNDYQNIKLNPQPSKVNSALPNALLIKEAGIPVAVTAA
uniref:ANK_REP_REGION domain-containing protein n=1 Tax=Meloidogyne hapla TaxID=6305 RepID=A0A1I8BXF7_MELHA